MTGYPFQFGKWLRHGAKHKPTRRDYWLQMALGWFGLTFMVPVAVAAIGYARDAPRATEYAYLHGLGAGTAVAVASLFVVIGVQSAVQLWRTRADS